MMTRLNILSLFLVAGLLACGPPKGDPPRDLEAEALRFAQATCAAREACRCDDGRYDSREGCESDLVNRFMTLIDAGASFNEDCFDTLLESEAMSCATWPYETFDYSECNPIEGDGKEGDPCEWHPDLYPLFASDCAGDLVCEAGRCVSERSTSYNHGEGEPCYKGPLHTCASGLFCGDDDVCHPDLELGMPCMDVRACEVGEGYCAGLGADGVGVCSELVGIGEACDPRDLFACTEPLAWCGPSGDGYACQEGVPGICRLTFPLVP